VTLSTGHPVSHGTAAPKPGIVGDAKLFGAMSFTRITA
jgi:hypothetical protein